MQNALRLLLSLIIGLITPGFFFPGGGTTSGGGGGGGAVVDQRSFYNCGSVTACAGSGTTTPNGPDSNTFPTQIEAEFPPGAVPVGQIAVPNVGGVPLARWQRDEPERPWPDGSDSGGTYSLMLPQMAPGARVTVQWKTQVGSYNNSTTGAVSDFTSDPHGQWKIVLSGMTDAYFGAWNSALPFSYVGFYVSGGSVTSGFVRLPNQANFTCVTIGGCAATYTVNGCTGVPPTFTINQVANLPSTINIVNAGSGCATDGSGTYVLDSNTILTALGATAPVCASLTATPATACWYKRGPLVDALFVHGQFLDQTGGTPHPWKIGAFYIEHWKNSDGSTYAFRGSGFDTNMGYRHSAAVPVETFDYDFFNGTTEIRGAALGNNLYKRITNHMSGAESSFGPTTRPDWSVNSDALNAVIPSLTAADKVYFHANHAYPPMDDTIVPAFPVPPLAAKAGSYLNMDACSYFPGTAGCMDDYVSNSNGPGAHPFLGPANFAGTYHYMVQNTASDHGQGWLRNSRVVCAAEEDVAFGPVEIDTFHPVDVIPDALWITTKPTALTDPVRPLASVTVGDMTTGSSFYDVFSGANALGPGTSHYPSFCYYIVTLEGEKWAKDALGFSAAYATMTPSPWLTGQTQFGGRTYVNGEWTQLPNHRIGFWYDLAVSLPVRFMDPNDPAAAYYQEIMEQGDQEMVDWLPYVGSATFPIAPTSPISTIKPADDTALGVLSTPADFQVTGGSNPSPEPGGSMFMEFYGGMIKLGKAMMFGGRYPNIDTINHIFDDNFLIKIQTQPCIYNFYSYWYSWTGDDVGTPNPPGWDATNPLVHDTGNQYLRVNTLEGFSGSPMVVAAVHAAAGAFTNSWTLAASGSSGNILKLSNTSGIGMVPGEVITDSTNTAIMPLDATHATTIVSVDSPTQIHISTTLSTPPAVNDGILFSRRLDYPDIGQGQTVGTPMPSGSATRFTRIDLNSGFPNIFQVGTIPPASTPTTSLPTWYWYQHCDTVRTNCPIAGDTIGYLSTDQAGTNPITWNAHWSANTMWVANQTCPTPSASVGTWNGLDFHAPQGRISEGRAVDLLRAAVYGPTADTNTALTKIGTVLTSSDFNADLDAMVWAYASSY